MYHDIKLSMTYQKPYIHNILVKLDNIKFSSKRTLFNESFFRYPCGDVSYNINQVTHNFESIGIKR